MDSLYSNYWEFLEKRNAFGQIPRPVIRSYPSKELSPLDHLYFDYLGDRKLILDIGAGDAKLRDKFLANGFQGRYLTCDPAKNRKHDFASVEEALASGLKFDAILVLEVIEHLSLGEFNKFVKQVLELLQPNGKIVISTPNAQAINSTWAGDYTHIKTYPLPDLWAIFTLLGFDCKPYRVSITSETLTLRDRIRAFLAKVITNILGVDYAVGVVILGCRR